MTPRMSIIGAAIRKLIAAISSVGDYYWDNVVLAMRMDTGVDELWASTSLLMPMDGTTFVDLKSHTVTVTGSVVLSATQSKFGGKSAYFSGGIVSLNISASTDLGLGVGDFTVECWVYTASTGTIIDLRSAAGNLGLFSIYTGYIALWNGSVFIKGVTLLPTSTWNHLSWVRLNGVITMYVNGVIDGITATSGDFGSTRPACIGSELSGGRYLTGYIDDLRITKAARYIDEFTPPKHASLTNTTQSFVEETGKTITVNGDSSISTTVKKFGTASTYFDGAGDFLTVTDSPDFDCPGDFTVEAWVHIPTTGGFKTIFSFGSATGLLWVNGGTLQWYTGSVSASHQTTFSQGVWHHVAYVRQSGTGYLYLDGVKATTGLTDANSYTPSGPVIGASGTGGADTMTGYIDDLRVTRGIARYGDNFTPPAEAIQITKKPYVDPYWNNVVLAMHMDGVDYGTAIADVKGHSITINGNACTRTATKKFGTASTYLDGVGDFLTVTDSSDFDCPGDFTVEAWVHIPTTGGFKTIFSFGSATGLLWVNGGTLQWYTGSVSASHQTTFSQGVWHHVAYVRQSGIGYLYLDGVKATTGLTDASSYTPSGPVIGASGTGGADTMTGYIDDLRVTKGITRYTANFLPTLLPFPETSGNGNLIVADPYYNSVVLSLHMGGTNGSTTFTDSSLKLQAVVAVNQTQLSTAQKKFGTASALFDGINDALHVTSNPTDFTFAGNFTFELWVYFNTLADPGDYFYLLDQRHGATNSFYLIVENVNKRVTFSLVGTGSSTGTTVLTTGVWHHIAVVRSGSSIQLFVNGVPEGTPLTSSATLSPGSSSYPLKISQNGFNSTSTLNGYIDDVRITKGVARYISNFIPPYENPDVLPQ